MIKIKCTCTCVRERATEARTSATPEEREKKISSDYQVTICCVCVVVQIFKELLQSESKRPRLCKRKITYFINTKIPQITVSQHLRGGRGMFGERTGKTAGNYCCFGVNVGIVFNASFKS